MNVVVDHLHFDTEGSLLALGPHGCNTHLQHPEGLLPAGHTYQGGHIIAGAFTLETKGNASDIFVDFISLAEPWRVQRWVVGSDGICRQPREITLAIEKPIGSKYIISPRLIETLQRRSNDLEIYSILRMLCGRGVAEDYLKSFIAEHRAEASAPCRLVIIFNHNYSRNCRALHSFYSNRFPDIDFVLPCVAPKHPNYHSYPFGSFQFHGLIQSYLRDRFPADCSTVHSYLFMQDDVLLHPRITMKSMTELLADKHAAWFPFNRKYDFDSSKWCWAERIRNSFNKQRDHQTGSGFEGLSSVVSTQELHNGVSDCFAVRASLVPEFIDRLGPMVAGNLWPELAIPTALFDTVSSAGLEVLIQPGTLLWEKRRALVNDPEFIKSFLASEAAFLHPVKIAASNGAVLQSLRDAMRDYH